MQLPMASCAHQCRASMQSPAVRNSELIPVSMCWLCWHQLDLMAYARERCQAIATVPFCLWTCSTSVQMGFKAEVQSE